MSLHGDYETLLGLSQKMEILAREQAWDNLIETESERHELMNCLDVSELPRLTKAQQVAVVTIIKQIQDCDQKVLDYVLPWKEHVHPLLTRFEPKS